MKIFCTFFDKSLAQKLSDKMEDINCLIASIPALDQLIEGLSRSASS